jgi:hypothetical protein
MMMFKSTICQECVVQEIEVQILDNLIQRIALVKDNNFPCYRVTIQQMMPPNSHAISTTWLYNGKVEIFINTNDQFALLLIIMVSV